MNEETDELGLDLDQDAKIPEPVNHVGKEHPIDLEYAARRLHTAVEVRMAHGIGAARSLELLEAHNALGELLSRIQEGER